jgi:hypothetical protein
MKCSKCGAKALSEFCFKCKPKKPLSSGKGLNRKMSVISSKNPRNVYNDGHILQMKEFFELCWKNKPHYCEVSGKYLGNRCSSLYQHHILPKSKYPQACFDEENIVFLQPEIHASVELDMYKYEYINKKRELLKIKYNIL